MSTMNKARRIDIWMLLDDVAAIVMRLRDGVDRLTVTTVRHDYIEDVIDLRDKLNQVNELIEETIN